MRKPTQVLMMNTTMVSASVTTIWLVKVKSYGQTPSKLPNRMKKNSVKTKGKKARPSGPMVSRHIE